MIFSKKTIRTTAIPTRHSMIGSPERVKIQRSSIPKIRKIHSCVWKLEVKNSQNSQFWPKNGQIFVLNDQKFATLEFSRHREYDFLIAITSFYHTFSIVASTCSETARDFEANVGEAGT